MANDLTMVAMSGGVDSSLSAFLLHREGRPLAGLFMKNWEEEDEAAGCPAEQDAADAQAVAERLGIPFYARNFAAEYWDRVFTRFIAEYRRGWTPNPDILCNREIKFDVFLAHAADLGAGRIATGHYCRKITEDGVHFLLKGRDSDKDQSYFLSALSQAQLAHAEFPLGEWTKRQVRAEARAAGIPVHAKRDSTGICFIGERRLGEFLARYIADTPGPIVDPGGRQLGRHQGLHRFTLGQRQGIGIGGVRDAPEAPWYVIAKDPARNTIVVAQDPEHPALLADRLEAAELNWIARPPAPGASLWAKIRYRQIDQPCTVVTLDPAGDRLVLSFTRPQRAVTPGQSVVLYDGDLCLGGGVIQCSNAPAP